MKNKDNLFILIGPTAIGKTSVAINFAKKMNGEIISADSMQIYKYMDIGSAKVTKEEMDNIPHHLIDIIYPDEDFTVANYKNMATNMIKDINTRNKLPVVAGGTGLYINSLVYDLNFTEVEPNPEIRNKLEALAKEYGNEYLYKRLKEIDIKSAEKLNINDKQRIIRAIEIFEMTGVTKSEYNKSFRNKIDHYNLVMFGLNMDRQKLYERINLRVDIMVESGLVREVEKLLSLGYDKDLVSMQGIGYKEVIMYLNNEISLDRAIELIKQYSRNYAKRQLTWFRRDDRINWIDLDDFRNIDDLTQYMIDYCKNKFIIKE